MASEHTRLLKRLQEQGFRLKMGGRGHWKVYRAGRLITTLGCTPGKGRAHQNALATLRRAGYEDKGQG